MNIIRFFVRLWYFSRNQDIARLSKLLERAVKKRLSIVVEVPVIRRKEMIENDPVLKTALGLHRYFEDFFRTVGCEK